MAINTDIPFTEAEAEISNRPAGQFPDHSDEISLLDILVVVARRKRFILKVTLICGLAGLLVSLILRKQYTAIATVLPPQQSSSLGSVLASQMGSLSGLAALAGGGASNLLKNPNDMYIAMFKSQTVEDAMIQRFGLIREYKTKYLSGTRKMFESKFSVGEGASGLIGGGIKDGLLHISVKDEDPERAAEMANGWIDQFRKLSQTLAITEASQRRVFFENQLRDAKDNLANAEEALKQTQQTTGMIELDSQARALIESAAVLRAQITAKEVQLQAMQTYATPENSNVVETQQELETLRAQLAKLGGSEDDASAGFIVPKGQVPEVGLEYVRKLRDVKYYETIFEILARQFEVAKLDEAREGSLVQVVDPALVPDRKSFPSRALIVLGAMLAGFILSSVAVLVSAGIDHMRRSPETGEKLASLEKGHRAEEVAGVLTSFTVK